MGINLFQGFSSSNDSSFGSANFFSDYASIRNGSYRRLMKAYYGNVQNTATSSAGRRGSSENILDKLLEERRNPTVSKDVQESNANLTMGLSSLKNSVSTLQSDSTYEDTANGKSAEDKVAAAVKTYVSDYNRVVTAAKGSTLNKTAYVANVMKSSAANADQLAEIGIKINANGTLMLNESKLKSADISKVQELFSPKDSMSYGSAVASRLQFAGAAAGTGASAGSTETNKATGSSAASLKEDSKALASDDLYEKVKDKDGNLAYDLDKIFAKAKSFVSNYNSMLSAGGSSANSGVLANISYIKEKTAHNADALKQFGISLDAKGRLSIDEDTFKNSDMSRVHEFFKGYDSSIATNVSLVDYYMTTRANTSSGYTVNGTYNVQGSSRYADSI